MTTAANSELVIEEDCSQDKYRDFNRSLRNENTFWACVKR